jgi:phosphate transport system substrate-binding protein
MKASRVYPVVPLIFSLFFFAVAPGLFADGGMIQIKGSDTMVNLGQAWAEEFMIKNPKASIAVTGGGSGTGIAAVINGTCDIAESSRDMKPQELELARKNGHDVHEFVVAYDALAVIVHPSNPIKELSVEQLSGIFTGRITNWNELGGPNQKILALSRERNSGTHVYFLEHVVRKGNEKGPEQFAPHVLMLPSSQTIIEEVSQSQSAIGYVGLGYVSDRVHTVPVAQKAEGPFVAPSTATAMDKSYPLARSLLFYTERKPDGIVKEFIDFVLSDKGQEIVKIMDFIPLR